MKKLVLALVMVFTAATCFAGVTATVSTVGYDRLTDQWFYRIDYRTGEAVDASFIVSEILYIPDIDTTTPSVQKNKIQNRCTILDNAQQKMDALGIVVGNQVDRDGVVQP